MLRLAMVISVSFSKRVSVAVLIGREILSAKKFKHGTSRLRLIGHNTCFYPMHKKSPTEAGPFKFSEVWLTPALPQGFPSSQRWR